MDERGFAMALLSRDTHGWMAGWIDGCIPLNPLNLVAGKIRHDKETFRPLVVNRVLSKQPSP